MKILEKGVVEFNPGGIFLLIDSEHTEYTTSLAEIRIAKLRILREYTQKIETFLADNGEIPYNEGPKPVEIMNLAEQLYTTEYKDIIENYSRYKVEFNTVDFLVPYFMLEGDWVDESWHNDAVPCFVNYKIGLAIWVSEHERQKRELQLSQYTVVEVYQEVKGEEHEREFLDDVFSTESAEELLTFINKWEIKS